MSVLSPYTQYGVAVAAVTVATGPYSDYYNITTHQDGKYNGIHLHNIQCIYTSNTLTLAWELSHIDSRNIVPIEQRIPISTAL